jgi:hypothetical protein
MSRSLRGGEKKNIDIDAEDETNIRMLEGMLKKLKKKKIPKPEYESPLSKMEPRAMPTAENTITIQGRCPAPFKGCDAISAQKAGKMCPDPRYAVFPYIQEEDTGALCYPNLDASKIQREINDEKKAAARHSVMQLIKVLAAFNDAEGAPEMCDVINKMNGVGNNRAIKELYCNNLKKGEDQLCNYTDDVCKRNSVGSSLSLDSRVRGPKSVSTIPSVSKREAEGAAGAVSPPRVVPAAPSSASPAAIPASSSASTIPAAPSATAAAPPSPASAAIPAAPATKFEVEIKKLRRTYTFDTQKQADFFKDSQILQVTLNNIGVLDTNDITNQVNSAARLIKEKDIKNEKEYNAATSKSSESSSISLRSSPPRSSPPRSSPPPTDSDNTEGAEIYGEDLSKYE